MSLVFRFASRDSGNVPRMAGVMKCVMLPEGKTEILRELVVWPEVPISLCWLQQYFRNEVCILLENKSLR